MTHVAAVLLLAPGPAVLVAGLGHGVGQSTLALRHDPATGRRRSTPRSAAFNTAQGVLVTALGALAFALLRPVDGVAGPPAFPAAASAAGTMYLVNTWAVAVMVALQRGGRPLAVWQTARRRDLPEALGEYLLGLVGAWALAQAPWLLALTAAGAAAAHGSLGRRAALARQEAALARQEAEAASLRELTRLKDEFLSTVSHELRTPLTLVYGYAELLQARLQRPGPPAADPRAAGMVARIWTNAGLLTRMVDDLLDFAHLERGALAVHPEDIDLVPVLRDVVASFGRQPGAGRLTAELPAALPAPLLLRDRVRRCLSRRPPESLSAPIPRPADSEPPAPRGRPGATAMCDSTPVGSFMERVLSVSDPAARRGGHVEAPVAEGGAR